MIPLQTKIMAKEQAAKTAAAGDDLDAALAAVDWLEPALKEYKDALDAISDLLFCTEPDSVQPSYRRFLENRLRERFDLEGAPIRIRLKSRHDNDTR